MPAIRSAGVLLYRFAAGGDVCAAGGDVCAAGGDVCAAGGDVCAAGGDVEVLLGHMGGPFWARKDAGGWTIPKGEQAPGEEPLAVARREFAEELGSAVPAQHLLDLGELRVTSAKLLTVFAGEGDLDAAQISSNTFDLEWPPRSGRVQQFPELDRAGWFPVEDARTRLVKEQVPFLDRLLARLAA